jgi:hypothetical protein
LAELHVEHAANVYNNQLITVCAESEARPPAFPRIAKGVLSGVFCMAVGLGL